MNRKSDKPKKKSSPVKKADASSSKKTAERPAKSPLKAKKEDKVPVRPGVSQEDHNSSVPFPIVGMGGSAGAFDAFEKFFNHMPPESGIAFVIVMHIDPDRKGFMVEMFRNYTSMKVYEAEDGMEVRPDHVYIIPPDKDLGIHKGKLLLLSPAKPRGYRMPIDYFFQSLAQDQGKKAVGIIFSGMGADGELGLRIIKERLGMVMVQDPDTAEYSSMPRSAISTNHADYILPPDEMPVKLTQYLSHSALSEGHLPEINDVTTLQKILMLLRTHTGHDFSLYKRNTVVRRIDRRLAFHQLPDYSHYVNYLRENPQEVDVLFHELLIGVTRFFRDASAFEELEEKLMALFKTKTPGETVRVWVAGCSTGEEAYSVAIIVMECIDRLKVKPTLKVQIFATDIDLHAIEVARQGIYKENIVADVSPARLERFFVKKEEEYVVRKELREMIVFAQHNLIKDAPFTKLDLLSCRNLMIYLTQELQKKLIPIFYYSLHYRGILFLGPSETIGLASDMFAVADSKWKLFERREGNMAGKNIDFPFNISRQHLSIAARSPQDGRENGIGEIFNKILLENYTPPSIIVNEKGDILYINGKMGRYLELSSGEAAMNIYKMAREELKYALNNAIHQARRKKADIIISDVRIKDGKDVRKVDIIGSWVDYSPSTPLIILVFQDKGLTEKSSTRSGKARISRNPAVEELEKELLYTKQQLHSTIEQMETSLEELKATNEELQSTNEELQSTNEESLTTKEEMQSLNEELMTINQQYHSKTEELTQLNNDIKNMLDSTEIGTLFVDNDLKILRFTPQLHKSFRIINSDIGRSILDIGANFDFSRLGNLIREVIDKLLTEELEIELYDHNWYSVRIMPYRTMDNFINGAVLTFTNITTLKSLQHQLQAAFNGIKDVVSVSNRPLVALYPDFTVMAVSPDFLLRLKFEEQELLHKSFFNLDGRQWRNKSLKNLLGTLVSSPGEKYNSIIEEELTGQKNIKVKFHVKPVINESENTIVLILLLVDQPL